MLIRCVDFETTGAPSETETHAVCEVGWCDVVGEEDDDLPWGHGMPRAMLVDPGRSMPPEAAGVHGIVDDDLAGAPQIVNGFMELMKGPPAMFCAFNADFEQAFFKGGDVPWIDPYKVAVRLWPDAPNHKQGTLRYMLGVDLDRAAAFPPHRAGPDAYVLAGILTHILNEGLCDLQTMARWSKGPALLPKCPISDEHRGKPFNDVPSSFLKWLLDPNKNFSRDLKATAKYHLKLRGEINA